MDKKYKLQENRLVVIKIVLESTNFFRIVNNFIILKYRKINKLKNKLNKKLQKNKVRVQLIPKLKI